jgi:valyl-tRNA synthetase
LCGAALVGIRGAKTEAKASQKTVVTNATVTGPALLADARADLAAVGRIVNLTLVESDEVAVTSIELEEATE